MLQKTPLLLFAFGAFAQTPNFDGIVDEDEWQNAQRFSISQEIEPADNGPAQHATNVFVTHTETAIYMGFIDFCDMKSLRSSLRSRDNIGNDDNVAVGFDPYGDGRYMIVLGANPEGNQFDFKMLPNGGSFFDAVQGVEGSTAVENFYLSDDKTYALVKEEEIQNAFAHDIPKEAFDQSKPNIVPEPAAPLMYKLEITDENFGSVPKYLSLIHI